MKLSMRILADELERFSPRSEIRDGSMTISGFRLYSGTEGEESEYVIIELCEKGKVTLRHGSDIIMFEQESMIEPVNAVIGIFDKYRRWDDRLQSARQEPNSFQAVLETAHEILQCPMFFGNMSMHIYAITNQYTSDEVFEEWEAVKQLKTMPVQLLKKLKDYDFPKLFPEDIDPAVMPSWFGARHRHQIRIGCYMNGKLWGHLFMYYMKEQVSEGELQLARHVADIFGEILQEKRGAGSHRYSRFSWLVDTLNGQEIPEESLAAVYGLLGWSRTDLLMLYTVTSDKSGYDKSIRFWIADRIDAVTGIIAFPYEDSVIVIVRQGDAQAQVARECISGLIAIGDHHCGVSFPFRGLNNIQEYYKQASFAIRHAPSSEDKIHAYEKCALNGLVSELKTRTRWREWITPSLYELMVQDAAKGTEYYETLYSLLTNKWHLGNTARDMHIHRNTLLYRIDKIKQMLDVDPFDESAGTYLRVCYEMLSEEYEIRDRPAQARIETQIEDE